MSEAQSNQSSPSGGKHRKIRKSRRTLPPKKQIQKLGEILDAHDWFGLMTLRIPPDCEYTNEGDLVRVIIQMLSDRLRSDGLHVHIGFLIKREFSPASNVLHYHVTFTHIGEGKPITTLPEKTKVLSKKNFLSIIKEENNRRHCFHYRDQQPDHTGDPSHYLKKTRKKGSSVIAFPLGWDVENSGKLFYTRYLSHRPSKDKGRGSKAVDFIDGSNHAQSGLVNTPSVTLDTKPYWSQSEKKTQSGINAVIADVSVISYSIGVSAEKRCVKSLEFNDLKLQIEKQKSTLSGNENPHVLAPIDKPKSIRLLEPEICLTCEYDGKIVHKSDDSKCCPHCHCEWDILCPF